MHFGVLWLLFGVLFSAATAQLIPPGSKNIFEFYNSVFLTDIKILNTANDEFGYILKGNLSVSSVWNNKNTQILYFEFNPSEFNLSIVDGKENSQRSADSSLKDQEPQSFYLVLEDGKAEKFFTNNIKNVPLVNLQRGFASLFQFKPSKIPKSETDSSGECSVLYSNNSSNIYEKQKSDCSHWQMKVHRREPGPLGVSSKSSEKIIYHFAKPGAIKFVQSFEKHSNHLEAKPDAGNTIVSVFHIESVRTSGADQFLDESLNQIIAKRKRGGYNEVQLKADIDGSVSSLKGSGLKQRIRNMQSKMTDDMIGTEEAALNLVTLLPIARASSKEELIQILKLSTEDIKNQLIDVLAAVQTQPAYEAATQVFKFSVKNNFEHLERFLQGLSIGTRPNKSILKLIQKELHEASKNEKLIDTTIQTLSVLARRISNLFPEGLDDSLVSDVRDFLLSERTNCETSNCQEVYIRGLQNMQDIKTISSLLETAMDNDHIASVAAMKALSSFDPKVFTNEHRLNFEKIFFQLNRKYDSSARTLALDILFNIRPNKEQMCEMLEYLNSNDSAFEIKTYMLQKIQMTSEKCPRFAALIKSILSEKPEINNYHTFSQKGLTTALERTLSQAPGFNETLISVQEVKNGILKRGVVDIFLHANGKLENVFKLGLYTKGLSSLLGTNNEADENNSDDEEDVTAGMEISVQSVSLRPLIFFNGQSELMGHVWSGTASEPTTAFRATTLLHDHEELITLKNGATVYLSVLGARSTDLNGQVQFSLWNRNAHLEIANNYGTAIEGSMLYKSFFVTLENKYQILENPKIHLLSDIDFYSDIKLCLQLVRPESKLRKRTTRALSIPGSNFSLEKAFKNSHKIPSSTLALNKKNNEMCNILST